MNDELILKFIDAVIEKAGLKLSDDFLADYRELLFDELEKRIWIMMVEKMDDEGIKKFVELAGSIEDFDDADDNKRAEVAALFRNNIENFDEEVLKVMDEFGDKFVADAGKLKV